MYVFPPQCLSPGLMKNAIWYIVGLFCDACENVREYLAKLKTWKIQKMCCTLAVITTWVSVLMEEVASRTARVCEYSFSLNVLKLNWYIYQDPTWCMPKCGPGRVCERLPVTQMTTAITARLPLHGTWVMALPIWPLTCHAPLWCSLCSVYHHAIPTCHPLFSFIISPC